MKYLLWVGFLLCASHLTHGQVPGFIGKRCVIFLDGNPTPAFFSQNLNNQIALNVDGDKTNAKFNRFAFNFRPQVTFEYLISRDFSLGMSYSLIMAGTSKPYTNTGITSRDNQDPDVMKGSAIGMHLKRYRFRFSSSIAPIGFYQTFSIYGTKVNTFDSKKSNIKQFERDFIYPVITFGMGRQSIIAKNILIKTGMELGTAVVPANFLIQRKGDWTQQEYAGYNVHRSLFGYYILTINLAIGYIPF